MSAHPIHDTTVMTGRSLTHVWRSPDTTVMTAVPPIAFLSLFPYVVGGAIDTGSTPPTSTTCCPASCSSPSPPRWSASRCRWALGAVPASSRGSRRCASAQRPAINSKHDRASPRPDESRLITAVIAALPTHVLPFA